MADKLKFLYGSTADIINETKVPLVKGQVYFAIDQLNSNATNGQIYFDIPLGNNSKRVLMNNKVAFATNASTATYASTANKAEHDENGNSIISSYLSTEVSISGNTLSFKNGSGSVISTITVPDFDEKLKVTSTSSIGTKIYLIGNTNSNLGTNNKTITSTGISYTGIYINTNGILNATTTKAQSASTATRAINDESGNNIKTFYLSTATTANYHTTFQNGDGAGVITVPNITVSNSGIIDISHIPQAALERVHIVTSTSNMINLTTATVQNGDVVKVTGAGTMYYVKDDTKLNSLAGYEEFSVGIASAVEWNNILNKPQTNLLAKTNSTINLSTGTSTISIGVDIKTLSGNDGVKNTLVIPAAATNVAGLVTTGAQTFAGNKTFSTATITNRLNYSGIASVSNNANYYLWMATASTSTKGVPVYSTALSYNPSTKKLNVIANQATYDGGDTTTPIKSKYALYQVATSVISSGNVYTIKNGDGVSSTAQIQNWYPSTSEWVATSTGITLKISNRSQHSTAVVNSFTSTAPIATANTAGILTSSSQTIGGIKTFQNNIIINPTGSLKVENPTSSIHSIDQNASLVVSGGISVGEQLSAKRVKIDNAIGTSTAGCVLTYDSTKQVLSFVFE